MEGWREEWGQAWSWALSIEEIKDADNIPKPHRHTSSILLLHQEAFHTKLDKHFPAAPSLDSGEK